MNTAEPISLAERLARVPTGALAVRLSLARTRMTYSQTADKRSAALDEIDAINAEMQRRGLPVTA
jgi:hypothetical protein